MFGVGDCEIVGAREVLLGTHVEVIVLYVVEHSVDTSHRCYLYRTGWKTCVLVCVVWAVDGEKFVVDTAKGKVLVSKLNGRVSL